MNSVDCHIPDKKSSPYEGGLEPLLLYLFYLIISNTDNRPSQLIVAHKNSQNCVKVNMSIVSTQCVCIPPLFTYNNSLLSGIGMGWRGALGTFTRHTYS